MKNLYRLQTLLVVLFSSMITSWTFGQLAEPLEVNVRNTGSSFIDQFAASTNYGRSIIQGANTPLGIADIVEGSSSNTLKVTFTPTIGAVGTVDVVATYYTLTSPMHPVTRSYRFNVVNEVLITGDDKFLIDVGAIDALLDVLSNDSITTGELFISKVSVSNAGTASVNATGDAILFTPYSDFEGDTWIQYIACDTLDNCSEGNIHVLVRDTSVQDHLIMNNYLLNTETLEALTPFENFTVDVEPSHGTLTTSGSFGWIYTPDENYTGTDTFKVALLTDVSRTYAIQVYDKISNVHARNDKFYVRPGLSVTFNVLNNDLLEYDVSAHTNPSKGSLTEVASGTYTFTPNTGYRGVDKFTYTTCFQDTIYCETATVYIHVTDLEPDNQFSYELQTSMDLPLAIDYPIEYTDFSYIISDDPDHGALIYYAGVQQIDLPCDTFEGYNMIVYEPSPGYTGPDHFEYLYCIQPSNLCKEVKVDMNVIEHPETENCPCTIGCVWPGDANQDGRVDMSDLLTLGNHLGSSGPDRDYTNPQSWFGQHADNWSEGGIPGIQFIDSDGDGTLTSDDVDLISEYYYQVHDVVAKDVQQKLPYQFTIIPVQYSLDSGDVVILDIAFGNATHPVLDLKGAKFSINIPEAMLDSSSVEFQFHQDSWLAEGAPFISLAKVPWDGRIDAGFARAKGDGATGFGVIATVVFIIEDDVEGFKTNSGKIQIPITLQAGTAMDNEGVMYDVDGDEFILEYDLYSNQEKKYDLIVYPNPANNIVNIHLNGKSIIETIDVFDPQGRSISSFNNIGEKHFEFNTNSLSTGLYYLRVKHTEGLMTEVLSVVR